MSNNNNDVLITLWSDKKDLIDDTTTFGDVIAITSARLESTHLTTFLANPTGPFFQQHVDRLLRLPLGPQDNEDTRPITIHELLQEIPQQNPHQRKKYTYKARIFEVETHRNWYFAQCSECTNILQLQHNRKPSFAYANHKIVTPNIQYFLNARITDDTDTTKVVIYNETMMEFLKIECQVMVLDMEYYDQKILPPPISAMIGVMMDFTLTVRPNKSVTVSNISKTPTNAPQSSSSSATSLPPTTPDPKSNRPIQETPGEKKQKMQRTKWGTSIFGNDNVLGKITP
ncbi:uncharacterized protein LOC143578023 [Bidens hawaiensis]|uniref:uncharacterized protein LOC143578023 n=1 Tax=Bidens hawaiensis TaxID=980011 RepID=UPI00404B5235